MAGGEGETEDDHVEGELERSQKTWVLISSFTI